MSNRAYKKLLVNEIHIEKIDSSKESDTDNEDIGTIQKKNIYSYLNDELENQDDIKIYSDDNEDGNKIISIGKKAKKKKRKKDLHSQLLVDDLLDKLILENKNSNAIQTNQACKEEFVLNIQMKNLNPENEIKRMFGNIASEDGKKKGKKARNKFIPHGICPPKDNWPPLSKTGLSMEQIGGNSSPCQTEAYSTSYPFFDPIEETVITSELNTSAKSSSENVAKFRFKHSQAYQSVENQFLQAVTSHNQEAIMELLQNHPCHLNTLLQLNGMMRMTDDYESAATLIERAICAMEGAFHPRFKVTDEKRRLEYKYTENRTLHIALFYHAIYLNKRGCPRTALEICKLLLSLDPTDPLGILLVIDNYALKSKEFKFLIQFYRERNARYNLMLLPNFAYSIPLAMRLWTPVGDDKKSTKTQQNSSLAKVGDGFNEQMEIESNILLKDAIRNFPWIFAGLLEKCGMEPDDQILHHLNQIFKDKKVPPVLDRLIKLYIHENAQLWATSSSSSQFDVLLWLEETSLTLLTELQEPNPRTEEREVKRKNEAIDVGIIYGSAPVPANICRHFFLAEHENNTAPILPPNVPSSVLTIYDPFPPADSISGYGRRVANRTADGAVQVTADVGLNTEPASPITLDVIEVVRTFLISLMPNVMTQEVLGNFDALAPNGEHTRGFDNTGGTGNAGLTRERLRLLGESMDRLFRVLRLPAIYANSNIPISNGDTQGQIVEENSITTTESGALNENNALENSNNSQPQNPQEQNNDVEDAPDTDGINVVGQGFENDQRRTR